MPVNDIYQARITTYRADIQQLGLVIRHWRVSVSIPPEPGPAQIAAALGGLIGPSITPVMTAAASYRGTGVQKIAPLPAGSEAISIVGQAPGDEAGDPLPAQCTYLISFKAALSGRRFNARSYIPFPPETFCDITSRVTAPGLAALQNTALALTNVTTVLSVPPGGNIILVPCIFHRDTLTSDDITIFAVRAFFATQRRRGDFGKINPLPF